MKRVEVRFEEDPSLDRIDVLIRAPEKDAEVSALMESLSTGGHPPEPLTVSDREGGLCRIAAAEIVLVSVSGKQVNVITESGSYFTRQSLQSVESALDARLFMRISRYEIVNLSKIIRYDFSFGGMLRIELAGGMETWASRRCIPAIRRRLNGKE